MNWFEPLPNECPPKEAVDTEGLVVYRITASDPPTAYDFQSHRMRFPNKTFQVDECQAMSLSVHDDYEAAVDVTKLPSFKKKTNFIKEISLKKDDGLIKQTGSANHYSWWRSHNFDIPK